MIALDLTRLISRAGFATPTGIDRVELAYARHLLASGRDPCFAAINAVGAISALPQADAARFVEMVEAMWRNGVAPEETHEMARRLHRAALFDGAGELRSRLRGEANPVYLLVSHSHLHRPLGIARLKRASGARFVCLIHDLIPLDYPQYTSRAQTARHRRRIQTVTALADAVIVNSAATRDALRRWMERDIPSTIAPLGFDLPAEEEAPQSVDQPYFVCLGTIEPRKNQMLLLDIWQRLAAEHGERAPRLLLVGRRGWGSEAIVSRLARLSPFVEERAGLPDIALVPLLRGAHAALFPSFAEGFGLPVIEALATGVPVLCSNLPALRESGGGVPEYFDPADAAAWRVAILDFAVGSPRRQAQLARLGRWRAPRWEEHFAAVDRLLAELS